MMYRQVREMWTVESELRVEIRNKNGVSTASFGGELATILYLKKREMSAVPGSDTQLTSGMPQGLSVGAQDTERLRAARVGSLLKKIIHQC
jgi:hypothetical protein